MNMFNKSSKPGWHQSGRICHLEFSTISSSPLQAINFPTLKWAPVSAWRHQTSWRKKMKWILFCGQLECVRMVSKQWTNNWVEPLHFFHHAICRMFMIFPDRDSKVWPNRIRSVHNDFCQHDETETPTTKCMFCAGLNSNMQILGHLHKTKKKYSNEHLGNN